MPKLWELEARDRAVRADAMYSPQMRSWSPFFKSRALWNRYVDHWREAKAAQP